MYDRTEAIFFKFFFWTSLGNGLCKATLSPAGRSLPMFRGGEGLIRSTAPAELPAAGTGGKERRWACWALPSLLVDHPGKSMGLTGIRAES